MTIEFRKQSPDDPDESGTSGMVEMGTSVITAD